MKIYTNKHRLFAFIFSALSFISFAQNNAACGCDYTIDTALAHGISLAPWRTGAYHFDPQPGQTVCLSGNYVDLRLDGIKGTAAAPIIIKNLCNTVATFNSTGNYQPLSLINCEYVHLTGTGDSTKNYGITFDCTSVAGALVVSGTTAKGIEIDHIEIKKSNFAGLMVKQDPTCDPNTWRDNMVMTDINIHHNYVHDVLGEGFYIGNSFWQGGMTRTCSGQTQVVYPHQILGLKVHNNIIHNTGWDGLQYGCSPDADVHDNLIENTGLLKISQQTNGVQIGAGSGGLFFNNIIRNPGSTALAMIGFINTIKVYNNLIVNANEGIFADSRDSISFPKIELEVYNNTLVNTSQNGMTIYDNGYQYKNASNQWVFFPKGYKPRVKNNVIIGPYFDFRLILRDPAVGIDSTNNFKLKTPFSSPPQYFAAQKLTLFGDTIAYTLKNGSYLINRGTNSVLNVVIDDLLGISRFQDSILDIGCYEYMATQSAANLRANNIINLLENKSKASQLSTIEKKDDTLFDNLDTKQYALYPTIADDIVTVNLPNLTQKATLKVYHMTGQLVKTIEINTLNKPESMTFNIKDFKQGLYICSLIENHQPIASLKFSKW